MVCVPKLKPAEEAGVPKENPVEAEVGAGAPKLSPVEAGVPKPNPVAGAPKVDVPKLKPVLAVVAAGVPNANGFAAGVPNNGAAEVAVAGVPNRLKTFHLYNKTNLVRNNTEEIRLGGGCGTQLETCRRGAGLSECRTTQAKTWASLSNGCAESYAASRLRPKSRSLSCSAQKQTLKLCFLPKLPIITLLRM